MILTLRYLLRVDLIEKMLCQMNRQFLSYPVLTVAESEAQLLDIRIAIDRISSYSFSNLG